MVQLMPFLGTLLMWSLSWPCTCQTQWLEPVLESYSADEYTKELVTKVTLDGSTVPNFSWQQVLLRYKGRIWLGADPGLQRQLLSACHDSVLGGHSGVPVTYRRLKQLFAWKGMKTAVQEYVKSCMVCQQAKPDRTKSPGLLQPLSIPSGMANHLDGFY
jgi:hypothetical protein